MSKKSELFFNTFIIAIGKLSTQVISVFLLPLYTTILSTEEYGIYDLIITITTFVAPVVTLLMEEAMFRFLIDCKTENERKNVISQTFSYIVKSTTIFIILIGIIGALFKIPYTFIFIVYLIAVIVMLLMNAITRGLGKIKLYSAANVILSLMTIILNVVFIAGLRIGMEGLLWAVIISNIVVSIFLFLKLKVYKLVSLKTINKNKTMKEMVKYSVPLVPNSLSWTIINLSDRLIVSTVLGTAANGVYSMAHKFPNFMDTFYSFFYTAWKESASKALNDDDDERKFYNSIYRTVKDFMYAIVTGLIALLPFAFPLLIKGDFTEAYYYTPVLVIATYFSNMSSFFGGIFSAYKNTKVMGTTTIVSAVINLVVNITLIHFIGLWAAAISTLIATSFVYLQRKNRIKQHVKLKSKIRIVDFLLLAVVLLSYYLKNTPLQILMLLITIVYCLYINKSFIKDLLGKFIKRANINA